MGKLMPLTESERKLTLLALASFAADKQRASEADGRYEKRMIALAYREAGTHPDGPGPLLAAQEEARAPATRIQSSSRDC